MSPLKLKLKGLMRRPEARHVGILTSGSLISQVALVGTAPILARLYAPQSFGVYALLLSIATIGGAIGGLCFEVAVLLPRSRRIATGLYALALTLSMVTPFATVGTIALVQHVWPKLIGASLPFSFYAAAFLATALVTQTNTLGYGHSRAAQYGAVSTSKVVTTAATAVAQIGLAFAGLGAGGLIWGRLAGLVSSVACLGRRLPSGFRLRDAMHVGPLAMLAAGRNYRDFLVQVPRQLLVRGSTMLPSALLLGAYGPVVAGLYFFAARLVERPGMLLGDALSRVPMKQFADRVQARKPLTRAALLYTLAIGMPTVLCILFLTVISEPLFRVVFGQKWVPAAQYAVVLGGWASVRLISLPIATLTTVLRAQRLSFYVDSLFAPRVAIIPILAADHFSPLWAVAAFCVLSVAYNLTTCAVGLTVALRYDRALAPQPTSAAETLDVHQPGESYG